MIEMTIPGRGTFRIENLVCDVNGTLAVDGRLIPGVADIIKRLRNDLTIHLITADTHGKQAEIDDQLDCKAIRIQPGDEDSKKLEIVRQLGSQTCAAVGQGANDAMMLREAALGICVLSEEGTSVEAMQACDLLAKDILSALEMFEKPQRLKATLRK